MENDYLNELIELYNKFKEIKELKISKKDYGHPREMLEMLLIDFENKYSDRGKSITDLYFLHLVKDYYDAEYK